MTAVGPGKLARLLPNWYIQWHVGLGEEPCNLQGTVRFNRKCGNDFNWGS